MCVIAYKPADSRLTYTQFLKMFHSNPDGVGYAVKLNNKWHMKKGFFTVADAWEEVKEYAEKGTELIVHFRIATHGRIDAWNTHPFIISRNTNASKLKHTLSRGEALLFHNGMIDIGADNIYRYAYIYTKNKESDEMEIKSDTWKFTELLSSILRITDSLSETVEIGEKLYNIYGNGSRIIIAANDLLLLWGTWHEVDGILVSNTSRQRTYTYTTKKKKKKEKKGSTNYVNIYTDYEELYAEDECRLEREEYGDFYDFYTRYYSEIEIEDEDEEKRTEKEEKNGGGDTNDKSK